MTLNQDTNATRRVLIIDNSYCVTGAFKSILSFAVNFQRVAVTFAIPSGSANREALDQHDIHHVSIPFRELKKNISSLLYLPALLINSIKLDKFIRNNGIAVVHVNDLYNMCGVVIKLLNPRVTLIYHVRLLPHSYVRSMYFVWKWFIGRNADTIVCVSEAVARHWRDLGNVHVISDAIETPRVEIPERGAQSTPNLLYLSNYIPGKGHDWAIRSLAGVIKSFPEVSLTLVGGDMGLARNREYKLALHRLAGELGVTANVIFKGFEKDIMTEMRNADIFLNFSECESFSLTCLEALHYGVPVVATRSGGPEEIIEDGVSGFLVKNKDVTGMENAIIRLLEDRALRTRLRSAGMERARSRFDLGEKAGQMEDLYVHLSGGEKIIVS
jgi:L-malate glycosyltransferase